MLSTHQLETPGNIEMRIKAQSFHCESTTRNQNIHLLPGCGSLLWPWFVTLAKSGWENMCEMYKGPGSKKDSCVNGRIDPFMKNLTNKSNSQKLSLSITHSLWAWRWSDCSDNHDWHTLSNKWYTSNEYNFHCMWQNGIINVLMVTLISSVVVKTDLWT